MDAKDVYGKRISGASFPAWHSEEERWKGFPVAAVTPVKYIWMNGELVEWDKATIHVLTHSLHYGGAVFEGARCYSTDQGPVIFRLDDHMKRWCRSARMLLMEPEYTEAQLAEAVRTTIRENDLESCYVRPIMWRGYGEMGVDPTEAKVETAVAVWAWDAYLGPEALEKGISIGISSWRQRSANAMPPAIKASGSYLNSQLAKMEANQHGYGEAVLLNEEGKVCEGSGENLFIMRDGILSTPPLSDGLLEGITRDSIMQIAADLDIPVVEESLVRSDLYIADEVFLSGSAAELTPVNSVDGRQIGDGKRGIITKQIQSRFFDIVHGKVEGYDDWLARI